MKRIKLKDPAGTFTDPVTGQRVLKAKEADLIEPIGRLTQEWLNAGGLVVVGEPAKPEPLVEAKGEVSDSFSSPDASSADVDVTPKDSPRLQPWNPPNAATIRRRIRK